MKESSALATIPSFTNLKIGTTTNPPSSLVRLKFNPLKVRALSSSSRTGKNNPPTDDHRTFKSICNAVVFVALTAFMIDGFPRSQLPAMALPPEEVMEEKQQEKESSRTEARNDPLLSGFMDSAFEQMNSLMKRHLESGDAEGAMKPLKRFFSMPPDAPEWKNVMARLLNVGQTELARQLYEEMLSLKPFSVESWSDTDFTFDQVAKAGVMRRLEEALTLVNEEENKVKEARDVRLIMAHVRFLRKNVEEALESYRQLEIEDPSDIRTYYCQGIIYTLFDREEEAKEIFVKYCVFALHQKFKRRMEGKKE
ncbi:protein SLOW GREEN 1, chloroplastic-like [Rutidosis leptorrhynchoides]|uniref:protein SLOW GREEN 1, chloroplastic-like n=1 Tax=Rutidosis leptorrhynchoides TaxID=125765 RepID=UPI003A9986DD